MVNLGAQVDLVLQELKGNVVYLEMVDQEQLELLEDKAVLDLEGRKGTLVYLALMVLMVELVNQGLLEQLDL